MFGVVPQEFVEETDTLRRGGMVLKRRTRYQIYQTHCKTNGPVHPKVTAPLLSLFAGVSSSISSFMYEAGRNALNNPTVLRSVL
jgi:hypothetical protein